MMRLLSRHLPMEGAVFGKTIPAPMNYLFCCGKSYQGPMPEC